MRWRKSSYSGGEGGQCVELAGTLDAIRDSKNPCCELRVDPAAVAEFLTALKSG
jgi:hypothetical protein